ncbi:hypothetical protein [Alkalihalobacillus sp. AL-G]|uniref:hypothetical protein n=1 Tax=Alkalihalobacillus sp. AL-G TaxID=2926399 RepID=UPI00272D5241|nr:hypothetical protein [Alkalihalobacillus sp. AL-G]WLD93627.1 hypothetical protein MOJ78_01425 [Alkalihalobacillus sp. AL-G]
MTLWMWAVGFVVALIAFGILYDVLSKRKRKISHANVKEGRRQHDHKNHGNDTNNFTGL